MTTNDTTTPEVPDADDTTPEAEAAEVTDTTEEQPEPEPQTFDAEYVGKLRDEAAKYRTRAKDRDTIAQRLHTALVAATGKLADPTDLTFDEAHLDGDALDAAIDELLTRKPHLAARRVGGDIGQGSRNGSAEVNLLGMMRGTN